MIIVMTVMTVTLLVTPLLLMQAWTGAQ